MTRRSYTIGQVSHLTGMSVRRLRFYADAGLLPSLDRTRSGYRLFSDEDLIRIDLIRIMREAGLGLSVIEDLLARKLTLQEVLTLHLEDVESKIASQRRIASALKAALSSDEPSNDDLRRIWIMTSLSHTQRKSVVERFFQQVTEDQAVDPKWGQWMARMSTPQMPDNPTDEQLDAWLELSGLMESPDFLLKMRDSGRDSSGSIDFHHFSTVQKSVTERAAAALQAGETPESEVGQSVAEEYLAGWATSQRIEPDDAFYGRMMRKHRNHRPNMKRYWDLVAILGGPAGKSEPPPEWQWIEVAALNWLARRSERAVS